MKKKKRIRNLQIIIFSVITFLTVAFGYNHFQNKTVFGFENERAEYESNLIAKKAAEEAAIQGSIEEKQAVINSHTGEILKYIPMGDSISYGQFASEDSTRFVSVVKGYIESELGYTVEMDDSTTKPSTGLKDNALLNLDYVISQEPDFVTIEFGTNDLYEELPNAYSSVEEFEENLRYVVDSLKAMENPPSIVLVTTWRRWDQSYVYDEAVLKVGEVTGVPVANIQDIWGREDIVGPENIETPYGKSDLWHPNNLGHELIAKKIFAQAYDLLK